MQRPFFSQSPNRVGSGPVGPPISRGRGDAFGSVAGDVGVGTGADDEASSGVHADTASADSGRASGRTASGVAAFGSARFGIPQLCQNSALGTTGNLWKNKA